MTEPALCMPHGSVKVRPPRLSTVAERWKLQVGLALGRPAGAGKGMRIHQHGGLKSELHVGLSQLLVPTRFG